MKRNSDGQGVIAGVDTDIEAKDKKYKSEKRRHANILTDAMQYLTEVVSQVQRDETYRAVSILEIARAVMTGIKALGSKSGYTGTIKVTVRPKLEKCKVECSYNTVIFEDDRPAGKAINKKLLYGEADVFTPIDCDDFDERQLSR